MKKMYVVCRQCGYAEKQEIYEQDEAMRKNLHLISPRCNRCGSGNVELNG